jgi:pimeloyl-ACP methyl ester carboxylesterase
MTARVVEVEMPGAIPLSGLLAEPRERPRGVIVALHGGGGRASYWDAPGLPERSLLRAGAKAGYRVVAVDRPGYGASEKLRQYRLRVADQVPLLAHALGAMLEDAPVLVVGHSLGTIVAVELALAGIWKNVRGLALGGAPLAYTPEQQAQLEAIDTSGPVIGRSTGPQPSAAVWYAPGEMEDPAVGAAHRATVTVTPSAEFLDARDAPAVMPQRLAKVPVPVQLVVAEHERATAPADVIFATVSKDTVETAVLPGSGHNMSIGAAASLYHRQVLGFADRLTVGTVGVSLH